MGVYWKRANFDDRRSSMLTDRKKWFVKGLRDGIPIMLGYFAVSIALPPPAAMIPSHFSLRNSSTPFTASS